jgi:hypothetical protein
MPLLANTVALCRKLLAGEEASLGAGRRAAAREEASVKIALWAACHLSPQAVKFNVARAILRTMPGQVDDRTRQVAVKVKQAHDFRQHGSAQADFARLIPDELVSRFAFCGEYAAIAQQARDLAGCGVDEVMLAIPVAPKIAPRDVIMRELAPLIASMGAARSTWARAK